MAIKFCPKCGSMLFPTKDDKGMSWKCRKCGHVEKGKRNEKVVLKTEVKEKRTIPVLDSEKAKKKLSVIDVDCPKCGNIGAVWWIQQTRAGDEPATRFFKCVSCNHTWREYA